MGKGLFWVEGNKDDVLAVPLLEEASIRRVRNAQRHVDSVG